MDSTLVDSADLIRVVRFFDIVAAVVFAVSGSLVASRKGMDVMGFMWFAVITGVGGGTVRDLTCRSSGSRIRLTCQPAWPPPW